MTRLKAVMLLLIANDAPLGPADDRLFDSGDKDPGLRDIFKRRK